MPHRSCLASLEIHCPHGECPLRVAGAAVPARPVLLTTVSHVPPAALTARQKEVALLLIQDLSCKQIASRLRLSEKMIQVHRDHLFRQLGVHGIGALTRLAILWGWVAIDTP